MTNADKTHCPEGHPYDEDNTVINPVTGGRGCRTCRGPGRREYLQAYRARTKEVAGITVTTLPPGDLGICDWYRRHARWEGDDSEAPQHHSVSDSPGRAECHYCKEILIIEREKE
jgi:hypothetical protein